MPRLSPHRRSLQAFDIRAKLYAGHISSVYRAVDKKSGITVGLKLYKRTMLNDMERHQIAREIWLHIQLNHPSIIALYAAWKDKDYIYLVLEWAPEVRRQTLNPARLLVACVRHSCIAIIPQVEDGCWVR